MMDVKEFCDEINSATTFLSLVTFSGMMRTICSYAEYYPEMGEWNVWMSHGPLGLGKGKMFATGKWNTACL